MQIPHPHPQPLRLFFFWVGIASTLIYRSIIVLNDVSAQAVQIAWYIGTIGFIIYFWHRYQISETRAKLISENKLVDAVERSTLADNDKQAFRYILGTLVSTKEKWNYIAIFTLSGIALIVGIILDFFRPS